MNERGSWFTFHGIHCLTALCRSATMRAESGCGPVAVLVFKTSGRGDELRRWVRPPRALVLAKLTTGAESGVAIGSVVTDNCTKKVDLVLASLTTAFLTSSVSARRN